MTRSVGCHRVPQPDLPPPMSPDGERSSGLRADWTTRFTLRITAAPVHWRVQGCGKITGWSQQFARSFHRLERAPRRSRWTRRRLPRYPRRVPRLSLRANHRMGQAGSSGRFGIGPTRFLHDPPRLRVRGLTELNVDFNCPTPPCDLHVCRRPHPATGSGQGSRWSRWSARGTDN